MGAAAKKSPSSFGWEEKILEQIPTPVMAVDANLEITYMNAAGRRFLGKEWNELRGHYCFDMLCSDHCQTSECRMKQAMERNESLTARNSVNIDGRTIPIEYTATPLKDDDGNIVGGLEFVLDITERVRDEARLREQSRTIREISTPAIKLWDGVVILPVVGLVDSERAQHMMDTMLAKITETSARVIILDIQGVAAMDTAVANHLIKITKATRLMGCQCIISGISPAVAQTLVQLGIELGDVVTKSTLKDALSSAFSTLSLEVRSTRPITGR